MTWVGQLTMRAYRYTLLHIKRRPQPCDNMVTTYVANIRISVVRDTFLNTRFPIYNF